MAARLGAPNRDTNRREALPVVNPELLSKMSHVYVLKASRYPTITSFFRRILTPATSSTNTVCPSTRSRK